jgi:hypothetical protein
MGRQLSAVNPYLRDPATRARGVLRSVATSSAIEGIRAPFKTAGASGKSIGSGKNSKKSIKR